MNYNIIDSVWYGNRKLYTGQIVSSGAVLLWDGYTFKAYLGIGISNDKKKDEQQIAAYGNKLSYEVAYAIFGNVRRIFNGKEVDLKTYYNT